MVHHLVLAGAGHAHLEVLARLAEFTRRGHRVTVVSLQPGHDYSGMGPGLLGGFYAPEQIRFPVRELAEAGGGTFLADRVLAIDPERRCLRLRSGETLDYDVLSCNLGSEVRRAGVSLETSDWVAAKPIENLVRLREDLRERLANKPLRLLVVGGGPAGVELAGNLWRLGRETGAGAAITLAAGSRLLAGFPDRARRLALASLEGRGITVREGTRVVAVAAGAARLADGTTLACDRAVLATGIEPPGLFRTSGLPVGPDGGLKVDATLRCPDHPEIFGAGDCIHFAPRPLARIGVYAVRQGPVLHRNLLAALAGEPGTPFRPQPKFLLIFNLGDGRGIACRGGGCLDGRLAFRFKDWLDRRFVARYQRPART